MCAWRCREVACGVVLPFVDLYLWLMSAAVLVVMGMDLSDAAPACSWSFMVPAAATYTLVDSLIIAWWIYNAQQTIRRRHRPRNRIPPPHAFGARPPIPVNAGGGEFDDDDDDNDNNRCVGGAWPFCGLLVSLVLCAASLIYLFGIVVFDTTNCNHVGARIAHGLLEVPMFIRLMVGLISLCDSNALCCPSRYGGAVNPPRLPPIAAVIDNAANMLQRMTRAEAIRHRSKALASRRVRSQHLLIINSSSTLQPPQQPPLPGVVPNTPPMCPAATSDPHGAGAVQVVLDVVDPAGSSVPRAGVNREPGECSEDPCGICFETADDPGSSAPLDPAQRPQHGQSAAQSWSVCARCYAIFHVRCLSAWIIRSDSCPSCRSAVLAS